MFVVASIMSGVALALLVRGAAQTCVRKPREARRCYAGNYRDDCPDSKDDSASGVPERLRAHPRTVDTPDLTVVGAGLGGLVTAAALARGWGMRVYVYERCEDLLGAQVSCDSAEAGQWSGKHDALVRLAAPTVKWVPARGGTTDVVATDENLKEHVFGTAAREGRARRRWVGGLLGRFPQERREILLLARNLKRASSFARLHEYLKLVPVCLERAVAWTMGLLEHGLGWRLLPWHRDHTMEDLLRISKVSTECAGVVRARLGGFSPRSRLVDCSPAESFYRKPLVPLKGGVSLVRDLVHSIQAAGGKVFVGAEVCGISTGFIRLRVRGSSKHAEEAVCESDFESDFESDNSDNDQSSVRSPETVVSESGSEYSYPDEEEDDESQETMYSDEEEDDESQETMYSDEEEDDESKKYPEEDDDSQETMYPEDWNSEDDDDECCDDDDDECDDNEYENDFESESCASSRTETRASDFDSGDTYIIRPTGEQIVSDLGAARTRALLRSGILESGVECCAPPYLPARVRHVVTFDASAQSLGLPSHAIWHVGTSLFTSTRDEREAWDGANDQEAPRIFPAHVVFPSARSDVSSRQDWRATAVLTGTCWDDQHAARALEETLLRHRPDLAPHIVSRRTLVGPCPDPSERVREGTMVGACFLTGQAPGSASEIAGAWSAVSAVQGYTALGVAVHGRTLEEELA